MKWLLPFFLAAVLAVPAVPATLPGVAIKDDAFNPTVLTVETGESVAFTNLDDDAHTVTAVDGTFDSKGLDTNAVWRYRFTKPGVYRYFCELHPFMKGTIVVKGATP